MSYRFVFEKSAVRDIKKLSPLVRERIRKKIAFYQSQEKPLSFAFPLIGNSLVGTYRFRIGDYRLLCDVDRRTIIVRSIDHRREVYRRK